MSTPLMRTRPRSGLRRPMSDLRKTVFPVPEGPSMTLTSPAGRVSETSCQMFCLPKDLVRSSTTTSIPIPPPAGMRDMRRATRDHQGAHGKLRGATETRSRRAAFVNSSFLCHWLTSSGVLLMPTAQQLSSQATHGGRGWRVQGELRGAAPAPTSRPGFFKAVRPRGLAPTGPGLRGVAGRSGARAGGARVSCPDRPHTGRYGWVTSLCNTSSRSFREPSPGHRQLVISRVFTLGKLSLFDEFNL